MFIAISKGNFMSDKSNNVQYKSKLIMSAFSFLVILDWRYAYNNRFQLAFYFHLRYKIYCVETLNYRKAYFENAKAAKVISPEISP